MKNIVRIWAAALLLLPLFMVAPATLARAEEGNASEAGNSASNGEQSIEKDSKVDKLEQAALKAKTRTDRLKEKAETLKIKLSAAEETRIKTRCKVAQGKVKILNARVAKGVTIRGNVYDRIVGRLDKLIAKLKADNIDAVAVEQAKTNLQSKIDTYRADVANYKVSLTDLEAVECESDPTSFKAALEASREALLKVIADARAVRTYVTATVIPAVNAAKDDKQKAVEGTPAPTNSQTTGGNQ